MTNTIYFVYCTPKNFGQISTNIKIPLTVFQNPEATSTKKSLINLCNNVRFIKLNQLF